MEKTKLPKGEKVWLIILGIVLAFDVFVTAVCFAVGADIHTSLNGVLNCVNVGLMFLLALINSRLKKQRDELKAKCEELQEYKDNDERYYPSQYDETNSHGHYIITEFSDCYWVIKRTEAHIHIPDCWCTNFIVKVFNFDPADEDSKATAKSKAEELLNLITEGGTLWQ